MIKIRSLKKRGKKEVRRSPLPDFLAKELMALATSMRPEPLWCFSRTTGWRIIKKVMEDSEITGIHATPKGLRHGFGIRGALEKIPVSVIQNWMGHSDPSTTAIYMDAKDEEARELMERMWT